MNSSKLNPKKVKQETGTLAEKATDPHQYDSLDLDWEKEGMLDSPARQFFHEYLEKNLEDLTNKSVVDIGSGTGHLSKLFLKLGADEIYGIESSHKNVEISRKLYPEMSVIEKPFENVKPERTFDVITIVMAFENMKDLNSSFQKISRFMKLRGSLYIVVGDKKYHTTERFGYTLEVEELDNDEIAIATRRPYGLMYDILRPVSNFIEAAKKAGFSLRKHVPLVPTQKFIQAEPKYKQFEGKPLGHLLIFEYGG